MNLLHEVNADERTPYECDNCRRPIKRGTTCRKCRTTIRKAALVRYEDRIARARAIVATDKYPAGMSCLTIQLKSAY